MRICRTCVGFILSCGPILIGITKSLSDKLEDANYYILRTLLGFSKSISYEYILKLINMRTLGQRRYFQVLVLLFRCIKENGPSYISEFFKLRTVKYNLRGSDTKLEQDPFNSNWRLNSFVNISSHLWNTLPANARNAENIGKFKNIISKLDFVPFRYR